MRRSNYVRPRFNYSSPSFALQLYHDDVRPPRYFVDSQAGLRSHGTAEMSSLARNRNVDASIPPERQKLLQYRLGDPESGSANNYHGTTHSAVSDDEDGNDEEAQHLEEADSDGLYPPNCTWTGNGEAPARADLFQNSKCTVWRNIHEIRKLVIDCIDDPYSLEQLKAPRMNVSLVRPLVEKLYGMQDLSIVYCLFINRMQFIREQSYATHHQTVNLTRALLCELLAEKILRQFNEDNPGPLGLLKLANILVAGFEPFQGAPEDVIEDSQHNSLHVRQKRGHSYERKTTALEIAIVSESKSFLASSACQKVVDAIYRGRIVYSPNSIIDIIPDHWKKRPISLYDPRRAALLNQYRMIVPRTRNIIEVVQFVILLILYIFVMTGREQGHETEYGAMEIAFDVYAIGWVLDQIASVLEHGWQVYTQNLWSFLDVIFIGQFVLYLVLRLHGLHVDDPQNPDPNTYYYSKTALDILSCAAPILFPRLAFNVMSDNMLFLSLRAMVGDFLTLTSLSIWCFCGFLFSLMWLHDGAHEPKAIGKWMLWIWFGLDGTGFEQAPDFHYLLGPMLMIAFAFLSTLFLTILVSMLSNTFSLITANAVQEIQYRRSVLTFMGVKSDAIFAYLPPFNLLALFLLIPLKFMLSPRMFHKVNVFFTRGLNMPLLIVISLYERRALWMPTRNQQSQPKKIDWKDPNGARTHGSSWRSKTSQFWNVSKFSAHGDIQAVFDTRSPDFEDDVQETDCDAQPTHQSLSKKPQETTLTSSPVTQPLTDTKKLHPMRSPKHLNKSFGGPSSPSQSNMPGDKGVNKAYPPTLKRWISRDRKDSMADYEGALGSTQETNARLFKLEQSMERIESFLQQLLDNSSDDESEQQEQLRVDAEAEGI